MRQGPLRRVLVGLALLVGLAALGCGSSDGINRGGKLYGKVTINGKVVSAGEVILASAARKNKNPSAGAGGSKYVNHLIAAFYR